MKPYLVILLLLLLFSSLPSSSKAVLFDCNDFDEYLKGCVPYLKGGSNKPDVTCCDGVKSLVNEAKNVDDGKSVCSCIKFIAQNLKPVSQRARDLSNQCGIKLPFEISPTLDCSRIK